MPVVKCPYFDTCGFETEDIETALAVAFLNIHNNQIHAVRNTNNNANNNVTPSRRQAPKIDRPKISRGSSEEIWNSFTKRWTLFKRGCELTPAEAVHHLFECCDNDLGDAILKSSSTAVNSTEENLLTIIKQLAVVPVAISIRRSDLLTCKQDHGESGRSYYAKLMGKADTCAYTTKCTNTDCGQIIDFTNIIVKDVLISGVVDDEIKRDVLGWAELDTKDINSTVAFIEAKEMARDALAKQQVNASISTYRKSKLSTDTPSKVKVQCKECKVEIDKYVWNKRQKKMIECISCLPCWQKANLRAPRTKRADESNSLTLETENIVTKDETCSLLIGSVTDVTLSHESTRLQEMIEYLQNLTSELKDMKNSIMDIVNTKPDKPEGPIVSLGHPAPTPPIDVNTSSPPLESAAVDNSLKISAIILDHHIFKSQDGWKRAESMAHPTLRLRISTDEEDYKHFGGACPEIAPSWVIAVTDTGAQSCLWGLQDFYRCGFQDSDLIPVRRSMVAANCEEIDIVGAVFIRLSGTDTTTGIIYTAVVMTYVSPSTKKLYLPREALIQLKVISEDFPKVGAASKPSIMETSTVETLAPCGCPVRALPTETPTQLPVKPCVENIPKMKEWLKNTYAASTFNKCRHQQLKGMSGPPLELHIDESVPHKPAYTPAMVSLHDQEAVKKQLDEDVALGVIEKVPYGDTSRYCHRMVVTRKADGTPRRTIDMSSLNKATIRETHHVRPPFQQARSVPPNTWKSVSDAWNGYHGLRIALKDIHKTTFITPWGKYRCKMAPQGSSASGDGYTRRFDEIISDIPRKTKCVDDTVQWDTDLEEHWWRAIEFIERCGNNGIILNYDKYQFCQREVEFAGFKISDTEVKPLDKYLRSIAEYPTPTKTTDIRAWFGLVNQVSHYAQLTQMMEPFRPFRSKYKRFEWNEELNRAFEQSKIAIIEAIKEGVRIYDISKPTCLQTDWSKVGIGYFLSQKHCNCVSRTPGCCEHGWKITLAGSRFLKPAESRYAPVEGEALAIAWALENTKFFTRGCDDLVVVTDHKPLIQFFQDRDLDQISNPRLFSLKQATLPWKFSVVHKSGKENHFADATSRNPASNGTDTPDEITNSEMLAAIMIHEDDEVDIARDEILGVYNGNVRAVTWEMVKEETIKDEVMVKLMALINTSFPNDRTEMPKELLPYWNIRNHLYILDNVVLMNNLAVIPTHLRDNITSHQQVSSIRVVVPPKFREEVISTLHSAHQGVSGMNERAKVGVYWPGITNDIQNARNHCNSCNNIAPSQARTPPIEPHIPTTPFEAIACDYFKYRGHYYLVAGDRLSGWFELQQVKVGTNEAGAEGFCKALRRLMVTFGVPVEVSSDWGSEFKGDETSDFFTRWGIQHRRSSAYHPQSNGRAELAVKTGKRLIMENVGPSGELNNDRIVQALLTYRNTPEPGCKLSPAQIMLGRPLRDTLPCISKDIMVFNNPEIQKQWRDAWATKEEALKTRYVKTLETLSEHARPLPPLRHGDTVIVQNQTGQFPKKWDKTGTVVETRSNEQYVIKMAGSGRLTLRNRRFIRKYTGPTTPCVSPPVTPMPTLLEHTVPPTTPLTVPSPVSPVSRPIERTQCRLNTSPSVQMPAVDRSPTRNPSSGTPQHAPPGSWLLRQRISSPQTRVSVTPTQLTFGDFDSNEQSVHRHDELHASTPPVTATPPVAPARYSSRIRTQRKVYDASTGSFKEPTAVPEELSE